MKKLNNILFSYTIILLLLLFVTMFINNGTCKSSYVSIGYNFTIAIPVDYCEGFSGKAYLMETDQMPLNFRVALSVEAIKGRYACSIQVYLGNVMVWSSGHGFNYFYTNFVCVLELTLIGDLRLKGYNDFIGWRTATFGQGVEKLQLLDSGNLVLIDTQDNIKWQTFNFPTNILLLGQGLSVATHLTSFPTTNPNNNTTTSFFSFEIHHDKLALYVNSANNYKYSYWDFQPSQGKNITYIDLSFKGLNLFDDKFTNFSQFFSLRPHDDRLRPIKFLSLDNVTGNLGFYYYNPYNDKFEASFHVINATCDLPLACSPYGICTFSSTCSCIRLLTMEEEEDSSRDCGQGIRKGLCRNDQVEMLELANVATLLKNTSFVTNISKINCANYCLNDCKCEAASYSSGIGECMLFEMVRGVKQVDKRKGLSYLVKVPKGTLNRSHTKGGLKKWMLILIVVCDGFILLFVGGGVGFFLVWKRRKRLRDGNSS